MDNRKFLGGVQNVSKQLQEYVDKVKKLGDEEGSYNIRLGPDHSGLLYFAAQGLADEFLENADPVLADSIAAEAVKKVTSREHLETEGIRLGKRRVLH